MGDQPRGPSPLTNRQAVVGLGLTIGFAVAVSRATEDALKPSLGYWGAAVVGWATAAAVGALVWVLVLVVIRWWKGRGGSGHG